MRHIQELTYAESIRTGFAYLLENYPETFVIGQGLWSPWYVGKSMQDLDRDFGRDRIIDSPVSESACTGAALGAAIAGMKPIVVHPRVDFLLYATDAIVNEAAKWFYMTGGQSRAGLTIRAIINRGGEQGAQHSQALHSWFAHIPGLRVVLPSTVQDARDLLIASTLCPDPVMYIDDRWLYETVGPVGPYDQCPLDSIGPLVCCPGEDVTVVASGFSTNLAQQAHEILAREGIFIEVIDLRVISPFDPSAIVESVRRTRRLLVVDGGWATSGFSAEVIAAVAENTEANTLLTAPRRVTLPACPAPTSHVLEKVYYPDTELVVANLRALINTTTV